MTSATKTKITTSVIDGVTVKINESDSEASDMRLIVTRDAWREARDALAEVKGLSEAMSAAAESGELDVDDVDQLTSAEAKAAHLATLEAARRRAYDVAKREAVTSDVALGVAVAPFIAEALGAVPVEVWNHRPARLPAASDLPLLVVVQRGPNRSSPISGALSGRVVLWLLRGNLHAPMTDQRMRAIMADLDRRFIRGEVRQEIVSVEIDGSGVADRVALEVAAAMPHMPFIGDIADPRMVAPAVANVVGSVVADAREKLVSYQGGAWDLSVARSTAKIVSETVRDDGKRTRVVSADVWALAGHGMLRRDETPDVVRAAAEAMIGHSFAEMGRLTKVDVRPLPPRQGVPPMPMTVTCTLVSRVASA